MSNVESRPRHVNYEAYIRSPEWKEKRWQVKHRAHGRCENPECGVRLRKGWHCHHLTYVRLGNELLEDLQALCEHCHRELHGLRMLPSKNRKRRKNIRKGPSKRQLQEFQWQAASREFAAKFERNRASLVSEFNPLGRKFDKHGNPL